jgi:hypothetical protein
MVALHRAICGPLCIPVLLAFGQPLQVRELQAIFPL